MVDSFLSSFLPSFIPSCLPVFLLSFLVSILPSFLPFFLIFLPFVLPSNPPSFMFALFLNRLLWVKLVPCCCVAWLRRLTEFCRHKFTFSLCTCGSLVNRRCGHLRLNCLAHCAMEEPSTGSSVRSVLDACQVDGRHCHLHCHIDAGRLLHDLMLIDGLL